MNLLLKLTIFFIFQFSLNANEIFINDKTSNKEILSQSKILIVKNKNLTIDEIKNIDFKKNKENTLAFGYSPDFNVWIKFTLTNTSNKNINKLLVYKNSLTSNIEFYDGENVLKEGLFNVKDTRRSIYPNFNINLKANETKDYYLKVSSYITTLIIKLSIEDLNVHYEKQLNKQVVFALFFGAMIILAIYNLFIFFFTKDVSYFYYVMYIFAMVIHHLAYIGVLPIYVFNSEFMPLVIEAAPLIVAFPVFALALFMRSFLQVKQYFILDKILVAFIILIPIVTTFFLLTEGFEKYRNILSLVVIFYLIFLNIYSVIKKNRQAYFVLAGWIIISIAIVLMILSSSGIFNFASYFPYIVELALLLEAVIFSIALADRINYLQKEKNDVSQKLIEQKNNEKLRLEIKVAEKTNDLKIALDEKGLLLKELNHRVKNNMQTIVSLIRLQSDEIEDENSKELFITIQNRINAMSQLHEMLYNQENISFIDANEYFDLLISELRQSYEKDIDIKFNIKCSLKIEQAVYCGLILNELVSNSFKHAFKEKNDNSKIIITLEEKDSIYHLQVSDNGIGYDKSRNSNLGLTLVTTLAKEQLRGNMNTTINKGVTVDILWSNNG